MSLTLNSYSSPLKSMEVKYIRALMKQSLSTFLVHTLRGRPLNIRLNPAPIEIQWEFFPLTSMKAGSGPL